MSAASRKAAWLAAVAAFGWLIAAIAATGPGRTGSKPKRCLAAAAWSVLDGKGPRPAPADGLLQDMSRRQVVLLGEHHDNEDHHRWQLQVLAALYALRPDMAIGFEMFPRRVQPVLDRWVAGELTVAQFLQQSEWDKVWKYPAEPYLPLFQFARINRIPMLALNVDQKLIGDISEKGWDGVPAGEREGVGRAVPPAEDYRDFLLEIYRQHQAMRDKGGKADKDDPAFRRFVDSQLTWDRAMAEALARRARNGAENRKPLVVGVMGSGHIRFGHGVPRQLSDLGVARVGTLLPMAADADCGELRPGLADAVFTLPLVAQSLPEPPRLGVRLEQEKDGVRIAEVVSDSLAEKSGLRAGDRLVEIGGEPASQTTAVSASIRRQPGGSWLPLRIRRGEEVLEVVVKFPSRP